MTGFEHLCMHCMGDTQGRDECPACGRPSGAQQPPYALPLRTLLQKRYLVGCAGEENGEGITYIGYDIVLNAPIELREFFPRSLCMRGEDGGASVLPGSEVLFDEHFAVFLKNSRGIAHLRELSAITQIYDIFEEKHTAFAVSEWDDSITLRYFVERSGGSLNWNAARQLFMPVLSALSDMHHVSISHLGISPDTLRIMKDGSMKLGGFSTRAVRAGGDCLPLDLVPGCAALEQYVTDLTPGEITDVYGFAASLFFALTGMLPQDALKRRADSRLMIPNSIMRGIPPHVVTALANGLQVSPENRTASFERLRAELSAAPAVTAAIEDSALLRTTQHVTGVFSRATAELPVHEERRGVPPFVWVIASCVVALIVFTVVGMLWLNSTPAEPAPVSSVSSVASSEAASSAVSSQAENMIPAPKLVSEKYDDLAAAPHGDYQLLQTTSQFSDSISEGYIISQSPEAGALMARGTAIVVVVSKGAQIRKLPNIAGMTQAAASIAVGAEGFLPQTVQEYSDTVPAGNVIGYKDAAEGTQMPHGSQVAIVVSLGPQLPSSDAASSLPPMDDGFPTD